MKKIGKAPNALTSVMICLVAFIGIFNGNVHIAVKIEKYLYPTNMNGMNLREILIFTFIVFALCCFLWKILEILVKTKYLIGTMVVFLFACVFGIILQIAAGARGFVLIPIVLQVLLVLCMVLLKKGRTKAVNK